MRTRNLRESFACAMAGISEAVVRGRNLKIHLCVAILVVMAGIYLGLSSLEWAVISLSIFMVLAAETMNSAIEKTVDLYTREFHPLARLAKNMAAGAVLFTAINAVIAGLLIFGPRLLFWFY